MDALIFDFDGVLVDSEPIHLAGFQQVLRDRGVELSREDYYTKYLGFDDRGAFEAVMSDNGRQASPADVAAMTVQKTVVVQRLMRESLHALPGAAELVRAACAADVPTAICSGALRSEIELALSAVGLKGEFSVIVSAEDVSRGKPDPQGFLTVLKRLIMFHGRQLASNRCVVVEDAPAGIEAARSAGMKVLAVATSYPIERLAAADRIVASLADVKFGQLDSLL